MIYTDNQLKDKIVQMINYFENEVVEFKEARSNYSFNDIGKYFSALSNEANLRGLQEAWLVFGVADNKKLVGTEVSFKVADIVGQKADYIRNKGLNDDICKQLIIKALETMGEAGKQDLMEVLDRALPEVLSEEQKSKKVSNLLQDLKREKIVVAEGTNRYAKWKLI